MQRPPCSTLFPYTTLFRSAAGAGAVFVIIHDIAAVRVALGSDVLRRQQPYPFRQTEGIAFDIPKRAAVNRSEGTRLNSSHVEISYAVFCLKKKKQKHRTDR